MSACSCCGGDLPEEGSESWEASSGACPGSLATLEGETTALCGAFDPALKTSAGS